MFMSPLLSKAETTETIVRCRRGPVSKLFDLIVLRGLWRFELLDARIRTTFWMDMLLLVMFNFTDRRFGAKSNSECISKFSSTVYVFQRSGNFSLLRLKFLKHDALTRLFDRQRERWKSHGQKVSSQMLAR